MGVFKMTAENSYKATLEILKVLDKHEVSMKDAKIIFASADKAIEEWARSIGAICFICKPFSNKKLIANVYKAIGIPSQEVH